MTVPLAVETGVELVPRVGHVTTQHILLSGAWQGVYGPSVSLVIVWVREGEGVVVDDSGTATRLGANSVVVFPPGRRYLISIYGRRLSIMYLDSDLLLASIDDRDDPRLRQLTFSTETATDTEAAVLRRIIATVGATLPGLTDPVEEMRIKHRRIARAVLHQLSIAPPPRTNEQLQRAVMVMYEFARSSATVPQVAVQLHMGMRALQNIFRDSLNTTPGRFLRDIRLDGARLELLNPDLELTVAEVARTWQFGNPGRFSAQYREKYGELPSETLARGDRVERM